MCKLFIHKFVNMTKQGQILKEYIKSTGISQEDFAFKLGYKQRQGLTYHFKSAIHDADYQK